MISISRVSRRRFLSDLSMMNLVLNATFSKKSGIDFCSKMVFIKLSPKSLTILFKSRPHCFKTSFLIRKWLLCVGSIEIGVAHRCSVVSCSQQAEPCTLWRGRSLKLTASWTARRCFHGFSVSISGHRKGTNLGWLSSHHRRGESYVSATCISIFCEQFHRPLALSRWVSI